MSPYSVPLKIHEDPSFRWILWKNNWKTFLSNFRVHEKWWGALSTIRNSVIIGLQNSVNLVDVQLLYVYFYTMVNSEILRMTIFNVPLYHRHYLYNIPLSPAYSWFKTQEHVLLMRTFQNEANYCPKSWCCRVIMNRI
jgi:hypothetical protein